MSAYLRQDKLLFSLLLSFIWGFSLFPLSYSDRICVYMHIHVYVFFTNDKIFLSLVLSVAQAKVENHLFA